MRIGNNDNVSIISWRRTSTTKSVHAGRSSRDDKVRDAKAGSRIDVTTLIDLLRTLLLTQFLGFLFGMNTAVAGEYVDYYGCKMFCEKSTCLDANDRDFWRYCNLNHLRLPVQIPAWSVVGGPTGCNEPVTGAWYCCRAEGATSVTPVVPPNIPKTPVIKGGGPKFEKPLVNGRMIDHCATWGKDCGRGGADLFCRSRGYEAASSWNTTYGPTWVLGSNRACDSNKCIGYARIICQGEASTARPETGDGVPSEYITDLDRQPPPSIKQGGPKFEKPVINGRMIDHCATWGKDCGRGGADLFCRSRGYEAASSWNTTYGPTWVLGSNRACDSNKCIGYARIICK